MNNLNTISKTYIIGIGCIGMSALERYFLSLGKSVSGYDRTRTLLTIELQQSGINIHYEENIDHIPKDIDVVVYRPAINSDHLDGYGTPEEVENGFVQFSKKIKEGGWLVNKYGLNRAYELKATHQYAYSFVDAEADVYTSNIKVENGSYRYNVKHKD